MSFLTRLIDRARRGRRPALYVEAAMLTDTGMVRRQNEDAALYLNPNGTPELVGRGTLAIVADGMGGHQAGEVASRTAIDTISRCYFSASNGKRTTPSRALQTAIEAANQLIHEQAASDSRLAGMGTTCVALALRDGQAWGAHVGDSRMYLVREGEIHPLTEDHSLVADLVSKGLISADEARDHADKNVILRALGTQPDVEVSTWSRPLEIEPGDRFLLSSDGLHDLVRDEEILALAGKGDPTEAAEALIALAKERGGHDNITVGILAIEASETRARRKSSDTRQHEVPRIPHTRAN